MQTMMDRNNLRETFSFIGGTDSLTHSSTKFIILPGFYTFIFIRHNIEAIVKHKLSLFLINRTLRLCIVLSSIDNKNGLKFTIQPNILPNLKFTTPKVEENVLPLMLYWFFCFHCQNCTSYFAVLHE